jgi:hypothetical protein
MQLENRHNRLFSVAAPRNAPASVIEQKTRRVDQRPRQILGSRQALIG